MNDANTITQQIYESRWRLLVSMQSTRPYRAYMLLPRPWRRRLDRFLFRYEFLRRWLQWLERSRVNRAYRRLIRNRSGDYA